MDHLALIPMGDEYQIKVEERCRHSGFFNRSTEYDIRLEVGGPDEQEVRRLAIAVQCATSPEYRSIGTFDAKDGG